MLYLLDANVLITAHNKYYDIEQVPEFWQWLRYQGETGNVKMPLEIVEEVTGGRDEDPLCIWMKDEENKTALLFAEEVNNELVQRVVVEGYAPDLSDDELEIIGRDPFLVAYAVVQAADRCVVTTEVSAPSKTRQNRRLPDVCKQFGVRCIDPFALNKALGFKTGWKR
jgi:hypothetical protein